MNVSDLAAALERENFDPRTYSLRGGNTSDTVCLCEERGKWHVYYTERGSRFDEQIHDTEDAACRAMLKWMLDPPFLRRRR